MLSSLIFLNQTAYLDGRFIIEGGRLIFDMVEVRDFLKSKGLVFPVGIEKAFDTVIHNFLIESTRKLWL